MNWWIYGITPHKFFETEEESLQTNEKLENLYEAEWYITVNYHKIQKGDYLVIKSGHDRRDKDLLIQNGIKPLKRGIYAIAQIIDTTEDEYKRIHFKTLFNFFNNPIDDPAIMELHSMSYSISNALTLEPEGIEFLTKIIENEYYSNKNESYNEGTKRAITMSYYERDQEARQKCLDAHKYSCQVCGFDFEKKYGAIGHNFIHVHHVIPLSVLKGERKTDPIKDLVPVCPNCHYMLHKQRSIPYSVEEMKEVIRQNKK